MVHHILIDASCQVRQLAAVTRFQQLSLGPSRGTGAAWLGGKSLYRRFYLRGKGQSVVLNSGLQGGGGFGPGGHLGS